MASDPSRCSSRIAVATARRPKVPLFTSTAPWSYVVARASRTCGCAATPTSPKPNTSTGGTKMESASSSATARTYAVIVALAWTLKA
jgi:hypothetical protein